MAARLMANDPRQPALLLKKKNMPPGYPVAPLHAVRRRSVGCRCAPGTPDWAPGAVQLAYVSNSAMRGVPDALVISKVIFFRETGGKLITPAPLPEARTAPVSWLRTR